MAGMRVKWLEHTGADVFGDGVGVVEHEGVLTDEHAACSYGQPVVVEGGAALGAGEVGDTLYPLPAEAGRFSPEEMELARAAANAGYRVQGWEAE